jgi:hypothetical protein
VRIRQFTEHELEGQTMSKPKMALSKLFLVAATLLVAACAGESTSPNASRSAPLAANKALGGVVDGVYAFSIDPNVANTLTIGASRLTVPEHAICALATTPYGPEYWNQSCDAEQGPVTITAVIRNAQTNNPSIEFSPAMRFSPDRSVELFLQVDNAATLSSMSRMVYCGPFSTFCMDESLNDASLLTTVDVTKNTVFRRIKHFSGYTVAE